MIRGKDCIRLVVMFFFVWGSLVSVATTALIQAAQEDQAAKKARISGRIFSTAGKPLAGARITLSGRGGGGSAKTEADGSYTVEVAPGTYTVRAERNGYVPTSYKMDDSASDSTPLTVEAGQHLGTINLHLPKGGVITGRIQDENGEPLVGEPVTVTPKERRTFVGVSRALYTDDRGIYRAYGLPTGSYYISVRVQEMRIVTGAGNVMEMRSEQSQNTYYPGVTSLEEAAEIKVTEGVETAGIDFRINTRATDGARILGRITNQETGQPMPRVSVNVRPLETQMYSPNFTMTDAEGRYEIKGLSPGKYIVDARPVLGLDSNEDIAAPLPQEVIVEKGPVEVNFEMGRGGQIIGQFVLENGQVPKEAAKFYVMLQPIGSARLGSVGRPNRPDNEGRFTIKQVPNGTFRLSASLADAPYYLKSVMLGDTDVLESGIPVESGGEVRDVVVVLSDAVATVRGRVLGPKGPLPGASVTFVSVDLLTAPDPSALSRGMSGATTDQRGQFEIKAIRPGRYLLAALPNRPQWKTPEEMVEFVRSHQDRFQAIELKPREIKEVDVKPIAVGQP